MLGGMTNKNIAIGAAVATLLALPSLTLCADSPRCSDIFDDAQRLACYDGAFGKPVRPAGRAPSAPSASTASVAPAAPAASQVAPAPAAAVAAPVRPAAKANDGPVSGRIVAVGRLPNDRFTVTLDNGQLWMQLERDIAAEVRVGDTVKVKPGMLGSFLLETRGGVKTRVKLAR